MILHYLSASRLKKYLQCTQAYYEAYENKVRGDAIHLRFGTMMHTVFERWYEEDTDIMAIYEEEWRKADVVDPQFYKDGMEMVENFVEATDKEGSAVLGLELAFAIDIQNDIVLDTTGVDFSDREQAKAFLKQLEEEDTPYIFGFIDRVEYDIDADALRIVDYKTSRIALTRQEAQDDEQLSMYALVAQYMYPDYDNVELELHYVRLNEKLRTRRSPDELEVFKNWLIHMYHQIKGDVSPKPTLNKYCNWCDAKAGCSAYLDLINGTPEELEVKALELSTLDEQLEKINIHAKILKDRKAEIEKVFKAELKASDNTPIDFGDAERFVTNNSRVSYDVSTVIAMFPEKFDELLSVKKADVDRLAKEDPEIQKALAETAEKYFISPTLRRKKKG